jgi:hypothetical protein
MKPAAQWDGIRRVLDEEKRALSAEIEAYPRPIAGCDAQFNHLLDRRRLLFEELARLEAARADGITSAEGFLQGSACLDETAKRALLTA